ncbi:MAG: hypothetical protein ACFFED_07165 [Candidatus Thorarchaeota archaeon]
MSFINDIKSWLWVPFYWVIIYGTTLAAGIAIGVFLSPELYWIAAMAVVLVLVIPITYRHLVGGGCSLKYQVCALVKGALVGMIYFFVALALDPVVWSVLQSYVGWNALSLPMFSSFLYQIWFYAGILGGFGARIVEVKQMSSVENITIAGFE